MTSVAVYYAPSTNRSKIIAQAMSKGIARCGDKVKHVDSRSFDGKIIADVAVFYGLSDGLDQVFKAYKEKSTAVYIDLGYWKRRITGKYDGYHKIAVNSRHPTAYFQICQHDDKRFQQMDIEIKPWQAAGEHILLAGMSGKAAWAEGFKPEAWERQAARQLRLATSRKILYRPKPNWSGATIIPGTFYQRNVELKDNLANCHAVVTHHSNIAVDAILAGIPAFSEQGVASVMSCKEISSIDMPTMSMNREQWAADIAWCQFTMAEMETGLPWAHLKSEGLVQ